MQTKPKKHQEGEHRKLKNLTFYRNSQLFLAWVKTLKEQKANFKVKHSKYTTAIVLPDGSKINFVLNKYDNKVFMTNMMVVRDLKDNPKYHDIIKKEHSTKNFGMKNGIDECQYHEVINIDISSAYATTMYAQGLISEKTFAMLQRLKKHERLPVMGMLAKRSLIFNYEKGKCEDTELELGDNRQIFFFLIQKVEECMQRCMEVAGEYYLFHWVDGVFIKYDIPINKLQEIEKVMESYGYNYKYEKVINFQLKRIKDIITIKMNKNGEDKEYKFNDTNKQENFKTLVGCLQDMEISQATNPIREDVSSSPMLELSRANDGLNYLPWLEQS